MASSKQDAKPAASKPGNSDRSLFVASVVALCAVAVPRALYGANIFEVIEKVVAPPVSAPPAAVSRRGADDLTRSAMASLTPCMDHSENCAAWTASGECEANPRFMSISCPLSCGTCASTARAPPLPPLTAQHENTVESDSCKDENRDCALWASQGECSKNAVYMHNSCPVSCRTCEALRKSCLRNESTQALREEPGSLNALFERAVRDFPELKPTVLNREPWVVSFENLITDEDVEALLGHCNASFSRSLAGDQISPVRTSTQCWCSDPKCLRDKRVQSLEQRVANITGVPVNNAEYFQVLRYEPGQFYKAHHDQNCAPWTPQGVRLLTFYIYLNDVEEGGGTHFTDLGITVQPKRGLAVLWPSVLDRDLTKIEPMTHHEALAPKSGPKYGANLWLHQYDFRTPSKRGCKWTGRNTFH